MRKPFIILGIALVGFMVWCVRTEQPTETNAVNLMSLMLAIRLAQGQKYNE